MAAAPTSSLTGIKVEFLEFPATITPLAGPVKSYFLGGAGVRGLEINGNFIKFTGIGVYLEETALPSLSSKWKGKTEDELVNSIHFFRDIIKGPYEKLIRGSKILPLAGKEYVSKVSENCVAHLKTVGTYSDEEEKAVAKLIEAFQDQHFPPGASVFYRQSPKGTLSLSFSKDETLPKDEAVVIENKPLSEAVLETMIGEHAVSPALKQSLASRLSKLFNEDNLQHHDSGITKEPIIN